jgi:hypothetical protein
MFRNKNKIRKELRESSAKIKAGSFYFEDIRAYHQKKNKSDAFQVVSDQTCNDLDFDEFFMFADRTTSSIGQQYLYDMFRTVSKENDEKLEEKERLMSILDEDDQLRLDIQMELKKLESSEAYHIASLFQDEQIERPRWYFVIPVLAVVSLITFFLTLFNHSFFLLLVPLFIVNLGIHYWNKRNVFQYVSAIPQLLKMSSVAARLSGFQVLKAKGADLCNTITTVNRMKKKMMFFRMEAKMDSEFGIIFFGIMELVKTIFLIEPVFLFSVIREIENKKEDLHRLFKFVGFVDSLVAICLLRKSLPEYCIPLISKDCKLEIEGLYHPLVPDCVANTIKQHRRSVLLTGSNMSGKTTFIRSIGLNILSGLTINTCFARSSIISRVKLFSAIRISDSLMDDKSYYFEEIRTIKNMIDESAGEARCVFLLDEIFKGTNTIERVSAGKAVLSVLAENHNLVLVSTHDVELAGLLDNRFDLYHFCETVSNDDIVFDYLLKTGTVKEGNAIKMLKVLGYPESVIKEASDLAREKIER